jgi:hypothetical protein
MQFTQRENRYGCEGAYFAFLAKLALLSLREMHLRVCKPHKFESSELINVPRRHLALPLLLSSE